MKIAFLYLQWAGSPCAELPPLPRPSMRNGDRRNDVKSGPAPDVLPPGSGGALLFGDPSKEGLFVLRLKFPAGYRVAPHIHPVDEVLTVMSGSFSMGWR